MDKKQEDHNDMAEIKCNGLNPGEKEIIRRNADICFGLDYQDIVKIDYMGGGLTNRNFRVEFEDGSHYAFRIAGEGTEEYLNRKAEKHTVNSFKDLGISPYFYWYDEKTGSNVCGFCDGDTMHPEDFQTRSNILQKAANIPKLVHGSGVELINVFDPIVETKSYIQWLESNHCPRYYDGIDTLVEVLDAIDEIFRKNPPAKVSCHNDVLSENFIYNEENDKLQLIDWEYGTDEIRLKHVVGGEVRILRGVERQRTLIDGQRVGQGHHQTWFPVGGSIAHARLEIRF